MIERALAAADPAEIEAQHRKAALGESVVHIIDDLIVHRPAELRMRMKNDGDRRASLLGGMETSLQTTGGTSENDLGHRVSIDERFTGERSRRAGNRCLAAARQELET